VTPGVAAERPSLSPFVVVSLGTNDPPEDVAAFRADPAAFDFVVTDSNMPYLSGVDVARAVRALRADIPVAIVSGFIDADLLAHASSAGVKELIFKAVDVKALRPLPKPVTLAQIKADKRFKDMALVKYARLSVQPVSTEEWNMICHLGGVKA